jgi:hypothetical protein
VTTDELLRRLDKLAPPAHEHCMHPYRGVLHMVVPDGHVVIKCCECDHMETKHGDHWRETT